MKLPVPPILGKREKQEYFLALLLRDEKASAVIIEELEGKIKVIGKHEEYFQTTLENAAEEEWLEVLDKTISRAEETLPPDVETHKTVFGVKGDWIEEKKIKKEYLAKLKKVSEALDLSPIGFLVISEAIAHLIQEEEGAPLTALLTEIGKTQVTITLFRAGKVIETQQAEIEESLPKTVDTLLKEFTNVEVLPSRIIIFDGKRDEELAQKFIHHPWSKTLPFLHVPQISVLPAGFDAKSVVFGAAEQMGFEVVGSIIDRTAHDIKTFDHKGHEAPVEEIPEESTAEDKTEEKDDEEMPETDADEKLDAELDTDADAKAATVPPETFGFMMGKDIDEERGADEEDDKPKEQDDEPAYAFPKEKSNEEEDEPSFKSRIKPDGEEKTERGNPLSMLTAFTSGIVSKVKIPKGLPGGLLMGGNKFMLLIPVIILLLIGLIALYVLKMQATVTVTVKPNIVQGEEDIAFSTSAPSDFSQNLIAVKTVSTSLEGSVTTEATGKKDVGDKAKGTVTIFNSDHAKKQISEGTTITSSNGLEFTTDKDVTVASASGDIFSGIKSGTVDVPVTADKFGTDYNLPSNTKFTVEGSSSLAAKNSSAFSGGTKKSITVVTAKDREELVENLEKDLQDKAKNELKKKISGDETLLPVILDTTIDKKEYDKNVNDEAKSVTLKGTVTFSSVAYQNNDLTQFTQTLIKNKYSQDSTISDTLEKQITDIKQKDDDTVTGTLKITAGLLPKINQSAVIQKIKGKSFKEASDELVKLPQVAEVEIKLSPNIPFLPKLLPRINKNINLTVKAQ